MPATSGRAASELGLTTVDPELYAERVEITRGGMGRIIAARDRRLGRRVAIKELRDPGEGLRARFEREALLTARLQHPAIVSVHEAGRWPSGEPFIAMKLVPGVALDKVIARAKTFDERLALLPHILAVADALAYAHQQRIVHRDLKPANVLVGDFGETVVIDWGLAKDLADLGGDAAESGGPYRTSGDGTETAVGSVLGTPAYMPVEQALGKTVDERADVYAIGAMLYHVLCGQPPYAGKTAPEVLAAVVSGPPPPLSSRQPGVPADLDALVTRAMAREPADRYPTAKELADDLRRFQTGQLVGAHRYSRRQLLWRWVQRHRAAVAVATIALVTLATVGVVSLRRILAEQRRTDEQRALAEKNRGEAEELLHFMLFELRKKLQPLERVDILEPLALQSEAYYTRNRSTGGEEEQERRAAVHEVVGDVRVDQGQMAQALIQYRAALAMTQMLVVSRPGTVDYVFNLAISHGRVADVLRQQGDLDGALAEMRTALGFVETVLAGNPPEKKWLREHAAIRQAIADNLTERGENRQALAEQQAVHAIKVDLALRYPDDSMAQHDLAISHSRLGFLYAGLGDPEGAVREFRSQLAIAQRMAGIEAGNAEWLALISSSQDNLGGVLDDQGDIAGAEAAYRAGLAIVKQLVAQDPDNAARLRNLAVKHYKLADVLAARGETAAAVDEARAGLALARRIAAADPSNADRQRDVAVSLSQVGDFLKLTDLPAAAALYRESMEIRKRLAALQPDNVNWQRDLASGHNRLGNALKLKGDFAGALAEYRAMLELAEQTAARDPEHATWQSELALSHNKIGTFLHFRKDFAGSLVPFRKALEIRKRLLAGAPDNKEYQRNVASTLGWIADALVNMGDRKAAGAAYQESLALWEPLATTTNREWLDEIAEVRRDAALCCAAYIKEGAAP